MEKRIVFLDYVRVIACFMVIMVHSCEFFFIDGSDIGIRSADDGFWVCAIDSAFRCSVPLFVMISGYLLVPVRGGTADFYRRRMLRVVVPFAVWSLLYATLPALMGQTEGAGPALLRLLTNFNDTSGHLWFVYMLVGLYLFMPVLSPWLERATKRGELAFLALWFASTFFPYLRVAAGDIYGECYWNEFHTLWYFSGFAGYVVLAHFCRVHIRWSARRSIAIGLPLCLAGYAVTAAVWYGRMDTASTLQELELSWRFCTPNVVLLTAGLFLMLRHIGCRAPRIYGPVREVSRLSYGIYLMHIFVLNAAYSLLSPHFGTPATIVLTGAATFLCCIVVAKVLAMLPGSKYIVG